MASQDTPVDANFEYLYKVVVIGNSGAGKTSFIVRYCDGTFDPPSLASVGIDFQVKSLFRQDKHIKLQIWDMAGQGRYQNISTAYSRGAMGLILMFDLTLEESFLAVKGRLDTVKDMSWDKAQVVLVGNKSDLTESRVITKEQGEELAQSLGSGVKYFETSVKEDVNVTHTVETLVDLISEKVAESIEEDPNFEPRGTQLGQTELNDVRRSRCCC